MSGIDKIQMPKIRFPSTQELKAALAESDYNTMSPHDFRARFGDNMTKAVVVEYVSQKSAARKDQGKETAKNSDTGIILRGKADQSYYTMMGPLGLLAASVSGIAGDETLHKGIGGYLKGKAGEKFAKDILPNIIPENANLSASEYQATYEKFYALNQAVQAGDEAKTKRAYVEFLDQVLTTQTRFLPAAMRNKLEGLTTWVDEQMAEIKEGAAPNNSPGKVIAQNIPTQAFGDLLMPVVSSLDHKTPAEAEAVNLETAFKIQICSGQIFPTE